jgi:polysaccharide pyruvyl transferase CsaB
LETRPTTRFGSSAPPVRLRPVPARRAIGICGSYGGLNVGDEAILTVALAQLVHAAPGVELTVFTRDVDHTRAHHGVDRVVDARTALRDELVTEVDRLDLLLLGGGGILYDGESENYLPLARTAQGLGVPTATYAIGAGPLERSDGRRAVAEVLNGMAAITVRDARTCRLLQDIGVDVDVAVTADPALLLDPAPPSPSLLDREGIDPDRSLIGMSVREPGGAAPGLETGVYHRMLAHAADFAADRFDANLLFVPMESQDVGHAHRVIAEMGFPDRATVLKGAAGPREVLGVVGRLDLAIGMRLHFAIFAAVSGVPVVALPYASKVTGVLERIGLPTPHVLERDHAGALLAAIDRTWDTREHATRVLNQRIPQLKREARRTAELIGDLLPTEERGAAAPPA